MAHDLVITNLGNLVIEADAIVVDPYYVSAIGSQHRGCYVQSHYSDLREDFPDMNHITRKGSGWRDYLESGDLTTMAFSVGAADCRAIGKRGPTWLGGHVYVIHASVCRKDGHALEPRDIDLALGSLRCNNTKRAAICVLLPNRGVAAICVRRFDCALSSRR